MKSVYDGTEVEVHWAVRVESALYIASLLVTSIPRAFEEFFRSRYADYRAIAQGRQRMAEDGIFRSLITRAIFNRSSK